MVTKENLKNGILKYLDAEVIPNLPTAGKWGAGTAIILLTSNYDSVYNKFICHPAIRSLSLVNEQGCIDFDKLANAMKQSAKKYGKMCISLPLIGTLYFSAEDVEHLQNYVDMEGRYDERVQV